MSLGLFSGLMSANAIDFYKCQVYKLTKIHTFDPNCVVLAPQLNSVFSTQSFVTVYKQAEFAYQILFEMKTTIEQICEKLALIDRNLEKRDIVLKLLYRIRQNLNFSAMEAWQHTSVGIQDLITREKELFEEERNYELNRLLQREDDTIASIRSALQELQDWFQTLQR